MIRIAAAAWLAAAASFAMAMPAMAAPATPATPESELLAVNRQVTVSLTGNLLNYKELIDGPGDRESGWTPGFAAGASVMFDAGPVSDLYASVKFNEATGDIGYYGNLQFIGTRRTEPFNGRSSLETRTVQVELGKGIFVLPRLLVTPVGQFGYRDWERGITPDDPSGYLESYHHKYAGLALHADFAAAPRLVLRGRLGWAETFGANISGGLFDAPLGLGSRPVWQAGAAVDYRLYRNLHVNLSADYTYFSYGRSGSQPYLNGSTVHEPSSWSSGLVVGGGLGVSF